MIPCLLKEIEQALNLGLYHSALALTLILPDICGGIAYPEMKDKRGNPLVRQQYCTWFNENVFIHTHIPNEAVSIQFDGEVCYKLRCAFLHSGNFDLDLQKKAYTIKHFKLHFDSSTNCGFSSLPSKANDFTMDLDVCTLCKEIGWAASEFYYKHPNKAVFENGDVIDITPSSKAQAAFRELIEAYNEGS